MTSLFYLIGQWIGSGLRRYRGVQYSAPITGAETAAPVNFDTAMNLSAVWACVKLIAETVASLPFTVYRVTDTGRVVDKLHPLAILFAGRLNRYQSRVEFLETVLLNLIVHGNAYCLIQRSGGRIVSLLPIMSAQVETRLLADGSVVHAYATDTGIEVLASESVWHLKLMGNGLIGMSPLAYQRSTLGIASATERALTTIYSNNGRPSGVLTLDRLLTPEQREKLRDSFAELAASVGSSRIVLLEGGMKFEPVALSPQDMELLSTRKYQIAEICRWYGVPSVMVNDNNGTTTWGSGIEQIVAGFYKLTLRPILEKIEASMLINLFSDAERGRYEVEFDFEGLLRADMKSRLDGYRVGVQGGIMTPNEARRLEGLPELAGGSQLYMQGATVPMNNLGLVPANSTTQEAA